MSKTELSDPLRLIVDLNLDWYGFDEVFQRPKESVGIIDFKNNLQCRRFRVSNALSLFVYSPFLLPDIVDDLRGIIVDAYAPCGARDAHAFVVNEVDELLPPFVIDEIVFLRHSGLNCCGVLNDA